MSPRDDLPIILVSAASESAAVKLISGIIDNDVTEVHSDENILPQRVWRISNKYYTADVCLRPFTDDEPALPQLNNIEAHIIYLTEDECAGSEESIVQLCETRVQRVGSAGRHAHVHLVAAECGTLLTPLITTAVRLHYEPVPLHFEPRQSHDDEEEEEEYGLPRVRAALHAHTWSGLKLSAAAAVPPSPLIFRESEGEGGGASEEEGGGASEEEGGSEEAEAVERAEVFAEALGALRGAAAECAALRGAERTRRAELLLAEFCRALGHRLDSY